VDEVRELAAMPSLAPLYARAGFAAIPGAGLIGRLPLVPGGPGGDELPAERLRLEGVVAGRDEVAAYSRVCGLTLRDELPPAYPHVLSFPLQLALMTSESFPFPLLGLVHVADEITVHRPIATAEPLDLEVAATDLRAHPRGRAFTLSVRAESGGELVWEESGTILQRGNGSADAAREPEPDGPGDEVGAGAEWRLPGDLGRRYAAVSGDRNPIHLHPLTARAFGFPRPIAHGMWSMARCLAQHEGRVPAAFTAAVAFRKPILLPGRARFAAERRAGGSVAFALRGPAAADPALHLLGELRPR
jgi:acyl dehydratase